MRKRCQSPSDHHYSAYGGRGIRVCDEWRTFVGFIDWALMSGYRHDLTLDRIDADGPYAPGNCRWVIREINSKRRELDRAGDYVAKLAGRLTPEVIQQALLETWSRLPDGSGLHLFRTSLGAMSWRYRYRLNGKERLLVIGKFPKVSLLEARELHQIAVSQVRRGVDPARLKRDRQRRVRYREGTSPKIA